MFREDSTHPSGCRFDALFSALEVTLHLGGQWRATVDTCGLAICRMLHITFAPITSLAREDGPQIKRDLCQLTRCNQLC